MDYLYICSPNRPTGLIQSISLHEVVTHGKLFYAMYICGSLQTILLCIVGEIAGGRSVTVAVGISDM